MGFGFLLFGYFFFCDFEIKTRMQQSVLHFDVLPDVLGWGLILVGLIYAARYSEKLKVAKIISMVMILPSLFFTLYGLGLWNVLLADVFYDSVYPFLELLLKLLFHYYLLFGLREIADACGDQKALSVRLRGNFVMTAFCFFWIAAARIVLAVDPTKLQYCSLVSAFCTMVYLLLNAFVLFKMFREITAE